MIELINVSKKYTTKAGDTQALNNVSIKFDDTGLVFIIGKSGCGKTTLLNMIGGLDSLDSGDIVIDGKKFSEFSASDYDSYRNTLVGFVFQEYNLLSDYNIQKNIDIAILCIPKHGAQDVVDRLVKSGIKGIWNFAPIDLEVPNGVIVENVNLTESLFTLSYLMKENE